MTRSHQALIVVVLATLGLWGCAQGENSRPGARGDRIKALEAKIAKLEKDFQATVKAKEHAEKRVADLEKERTRLRKEIDLHKLVIKERDELKVNLAARTAERDNYQTQFEELRKGIRNLLGQVDAAMPPVAATAETAATSEQ